MKKRALDVMSKLTIEEKISQLLHEAKGIDRLGIKPYNWWSEALHGVARCGRATVFPEPIGIAATFDENLMHRIGDAVATEGRAKFNIAQSIGNYGEDAGLTYWSPNVNIFRDPRWGRGMETFGEDPYLVSRMGVAFVKGMQGDDPFYLKTAACAKHYAVHSGPEGIRHGFNVNPSKKDLYETYLPAFKALVQESKVESVMSAYNAVYESPATGSHYLLTEILKDEWGFKGHVVSDNGAVEDINTGHHKVNDYAEAAARALKAGCDLDGGAAYEHLKEALDRGLVTEEDIDKSLLTLFMTRLKLGILLPDDYSPYKEVGEQVICCKKHDNIAREAARKSMVLIKNNGILPLDKNLASVYVGGAFATDTYAMMGNYYGIAGHMSTYLEGIATHVSAGTKIYHMYGFQATTPNLNPLNYAIKEARTKDVDIVTFGLSGMLEGEEGDAIATINHGDKDSMKIPEHQLEFLRQISKDRTNKIIAIICGGSPVELQEVVELCDAVIVSWYPGQAGGEALADLLFGDENFSGRLPITFPTGAEALPPFEDYSMKGRTYKYQADGIEYPFGYGLSYGGNIKYGPLKAEKKAGGVKLTFSLSNDTEYAMVETAQIYVAGPGA
ncbi:MAG: glycoside hydrolase family 3 N-terminal domain-containing protein, partial [Bacteroidia bacterium]|nr:glycoside hydrolase family 3 N-terminal domain-containing protein [Bacteroidia bacterium]